ncbi:pyruvate, phosphate dikinase [Myxococcota bacterium]|nr:pyruvate, phosphate dikinase [Myxococcota bacterium]
MTAAPQRIYTFGAGRAEGHAAMKDVLGGKGAGLAEMTNLGIPVPPGFTVSTAACAEYYRTGRKLPAGLMDEVRGALAAVESIAGARFGDPENPLLLSVRSGAKFSMPGMMDTVLNLGLNTDTVGGLARSTGDPRFAWDSFRRFVQMYGDVVLGVNRHPLEKLIEGRKEARGVTQDTELTADDWRDLVSAFLERVESQLRRPFPMDPYEQLEGAIAAVFRSWNTPRAVFYRKEHGIPDDIYTAVNVQAMVFGNLGDDSATGVAFTRDPATGEDLFYGEFLPNAQGEDVVAGIRTPLPINRSRPVPDGVATLEELMPAAYGTLLEVRRRLEGHFRDMQDLEFTIQRGRVWMLQCRTGKRTARAAVRIAVDMVGEGLIDRDTALLRVQPSQLDQLLHPTIDPKAPRHVIARGLPASPGARTGKVVFTPEEAVARSERGDAVILVRRETSPEDIAGMSAAQGILTARGGQTSHAAVVARGMGKCCVVGCSEISVALDEKSFTTSRGRTVREGDEITLDGATGEVMLGRVGVQGVDPEHDRELGQVLHWADEVRRLRIRTNADTPDDARTARRFGAEGIGLCRTEHMFFDEERVALVREMILAETFEERKAALDRILPFQRRDFEGIFRAMAGLPVTVRLLDPPLHEFLPTTDAQVKALAEHSGMREADIRRKTREHEEANPMLGHRGCRLGISHPEIYRMQVRAILEAACAVASEEIAVLPEIMIPLVSIEKELEFLKEEVADEAEAVFRGTGRRVAYQVGTMIELPRACLVAGGIARTAEFFSFGTNDLTQTSYGFARDDAGPFLRVYEEVKIIGRSPFVTLDREGVGELVRIAVERGRAARPGLKTGICGEHGGDPDSIAFCHEVGLDYVSCSPFRVPVARLAAAHAALREAAK